MNSQQIITLCAIIMSDNQNLWVQIQMHISIAVRKKYLGSSNLEGVLEVC